MKRLFSISEIAIATGGILKKETGAGIPAAGISTDTRTLAEGEAFFALTGDNHDAHDHLAEAAGKGAVLLVVQKTGMVPAEYTGAVLEVEDTLIAYQKLAEYYLKQTGPLVIAVTGSVGKTTLKDMIACILSDKVKTYATAGNLNNQVGLPRTILEMDEGTKALVLEMGMAGPGEIKRLSGIAKPDIAVITNIGVSHRENFDSDDGILKAKMEITAFMDRDNTLIINSGGNSELAKAADEESKKKNFGIISIGETGLSSILPFDYSVSPVSADPDDAGISHFGIFESGSAEAIPFSIPLPGGYAGINTALAAAASICAGGILGFDISLDYAAEALLKLKRTPGRMELIRKSGVLVIDDTYNASPDSAIAGLGYIGSITAKRRLVVLADMNELGGESEEMHRSLGSEAVKTGVDFIYAYGTKAKMIAEGAKEACNNIKPLAGPEILWYDTGDREIMIKKILTGLREGDAVYIKGSRSMMMEEVSKALAGGRYGYV